MASNCRNISNGFTHSGIFHADDVFSAALLQILNPRIEITRGPVVPDGFEGVVFDIGGGEFDHHGAKRRTRENGIPYASLGLLWERFGHMVLLRDEAAEFDNVFIQPLDLCDNGGAFCVVAMLVSDFNPQPPACASDYDEAFFNAVRWAKGVLERRFEAIRLRRADIEFVRKAMTTCDGDVLFLERYAQWTKAVAGSSYRFVVYPSVRGGFCLQAVDKTDYFPVEWRGLDANRLKVLLGIDSLIFCHPSGFMCCIDKLEDAHRVIRLSDSTKGL